MQILPRRISIRPLLRIALYLPPFFQPYILYVQALGAAHRHAVLSACVLTSRRRSPAYRLAASTMSLATTSGLDVITTCDAPLTTTVFADLARWAMKACVAGGMFLSPSP